MINLSGTSKGDLYFLVGTHGSIFILRVKSQKCKNAVGKAFKNKCRECLFGHLYGFAGIP